MSFNQIRSRTGYLQFVCSLLIMHCRFALIVALVALWSQISLSMIQPSIRTLAQSLIMDTTAQAVSSDDQTTSTPTATPTNTASVQYMITSSMRNTLEQDLGYTVLEVDEMEPQIAARVIERMLPRPTNGMPAEWRKPYIPPTTAGRLLSIYRQSNRALSKYIQAAKRYAVDAFTFLRPALPAIAALAILLVNREAITEAVWNTAREVEKIPPIVSEVISEKTYRWHQWWVLARNRRWFRRSSKTKPDIDAFLRVQQTSLWDRLMLRYNGIKAP